MFTPHLIGWYNDFKKTHPDFHIVFVSSDRDQAAFENYRSEMPWLALPWEGKGRSAWSRSCPSPFSPTSLIPCLQLASRRTAWPTSLISVGSPPSCC